MLQRSHFTSTAPNRAVQRRIRNVERSAPREPDPTPQPETKLKNYQVQYRRRKAAGFCATTGCHAKAQVGKTRCRNHLRELSRSKRAMCAVRARKSLCIECGKHPPFWGILCVICRERRGSPVLPPGARKALHDFRRAERIRVLELSQVEVRFAARKLLISGEIKGSRERALRLYAGIDDHRWRSYSEVAKIMKVSKEAVRKLLLPSKLLLEGLCGDNVPWRFNKESNGA